MNNPYALDQSLHLPRQICPVCPGLDPKPCFKPGHLVWCNHCGYEYSPLTSSQCPGCKTLGIRLTHGQMMKFIEDTTRLVERSSRTSCRPQLQNSRVSPRNPLSSLPWDSTEPPTGTSSGGSTPGRATNTPAGPALGSPATAYMANSGRATLLSLSPSLTGSQGRSTYHSPNIKGATSVGSHLTTPISPSVPHFSVSLAHQAAANDSLTGVGNPCRPNPPFIPPSGATNFQTVGNKLFVGGSNQVIQNPAGPRPRVHMGPPPISPTGVVSRLATPSGRTNTNMHNDNGTLSLSPTGSNSSIRGGANFRNFEHANPPMRRSSGRGRDAKAWTRGGAEAEWARLG